MVKSMFMIIIDDVGKVAVFENAELVEMVDDKTEVNFLIDTCKTCGKHVTSTYDGNCAECDKFK